MVNRTGAIYLDEHQELKGKCITVVRDALPERKDVRRRQDGYGDSIPTTWGVLIDGEAKYRRVYATCWSNVASHWVTWYGKKYYLKDGNFPESGKLECVTECVGLD
jgi:hypothetical protein